MRRKFPKTQFSEDHIINEWIQQWGADSLQIIGDDCAVLPSAPKDYLPLLKTDAVIEGVHFSKNDSPRWIGHKALARVLSDFAAMGGWPGAVVVAVGISEHIESDKIVKIYQGMSKLAKKFQCKLVGGETSKSPVLQLTVSGIGWVKAKCHVMRSGAQVGDIIFVTGTLGGNYMNDSKRHLRFIPRLEEGRWLAEKGYANAMMDLSDGLGKDLHRLAHASGVSFKLFKNKIPKRRSISIHDAVNEGEDYELLFTVTPKKKRMLLKNWNFSTPLSEIGEVLDEKTKPDTDGLCMKGFDHFKK